MADIYHSPVEIDGVARLIRAENYQHAATAIPQDKDFFHRLETSTLTEADRAALLKAGGLLIDKHAHKHGYTGDHPEAAFRGIDFNMNGKVSPIEAAAYVAEVERVHRAWKAPYPQLADEAYVGSSTFENNVKHHMAALEHVTPNAPLKTKHQGPKIPDKSI